MRREARIHTAIWRDDDWRGFTWQAQWLYELLLSQPALSFCGVIAYSPRRWAQMAAGASLKMVLQALELLRAKRFVVVDEITEELWVRTFVKNDGLLTTPNLRKAMADAYLLIESEGIRQGFWQELPDGLADGIPKGYRKEFAERVRQAIPNPYPLAPIPPLPAPVSNEQSSSSDSRAVPGFVDDDDWIRELLEATWATMARRRIERRLQDDPIRDERAYVGTTTTKLASQFTADAKGVIGRRPDITADDLADLLESTESTGVSASTVLSAFDSPPCPTCGGSRWLDVASGEAVACPDCNPAAKASA